MNTFTEDNFNNGFVVFKVNGRPPSVHSKSSLKHYFKDAVHEVTSRSDYIITGTCHIAIEYRCNHITRRKNPGIYDMDNIIKPILDSLVGLNGLLVDDVLVNRVTVNWQDTQEKEHFEVEIEYPDLLFARKDDLIFLKSQSGWCFPTSRKLASEPKLLELMSLHFSRWDSISSEDDYYNNLSGLPLQSFIYHAKIQSKDYEIIDMPYNNKKKANNLLHTEPAKNAGPVSSTLAIERWRNYDESI